MERKPRIACVLCKRYHWLPNPAGIGAGNRFAARLRPPARLRPRGIADCPPPAPGPSRGIADFFSPAERRVVLVALRDPGAMAWDQILHSDVEIRVLSDLGERARWLVLPSDALAVQPG